MEKPTDPDSRPSIYATLVRLVAFCLSLDPASIPSTAHHLLSSFPSPIIKPLASEATETLTRTDPDDFVIYSRDEAKRLSYAIEEVRNVLFASICGPIALNRLRFYQYKAFGVEFATEVVLADANIARLTDRVLEARRLLKPFEERRPVS